MGSAVPHRVLVLRRSEWEGLENSVSGAEIAHCKPGLPEGILDILRNQLAGIGCAGLSK